MGQSTAINSIDITWPDGVQQVLNEHIDINQITSIGRYCHTDFLTITTTDASTNILTVYLHDLAGNPLPAHDLTLNINQGPNTGYSQAGVTNPAGVAVFNLSNTTVGTDRISYDFIVDGNAQLCRALVQWIDDLIFDDGFESI